MVNKLSVISKYVEQYLIFVDTCSLMHQDASDFFNARFNEKIKDYNSKHPDKKTGYYIIQHVIDELKKFTDEEKWKTEINERKGRVLTEKEISERIYKSKNGQKIIKEWADEGLATGLDTKDIKEYADSHADPVFLYLFTKHSFKHKILLITQDNDLAGDTLALVERKSTYMKKLQVIKIEDSTSFNYFTKSPRYKKEPILSNKTKKIIKPFRLSRSPMIAKSLLTSIIPISGETVLDRNGKEIKIKEQLHKNSKGGEGIVYKSSNGKLCKIYFKEKITDLRIEKLKLMQSNQIKIANVIWPESVLYNINKEPVGCLMEEAPSDCVDMLRIHRRDLLEKYFPNFKRIDLVGLCIKILRTFNKLHEYNIIVGDVNPSNILLTPKGDPYFIDTDSYQIEKFPCPVGKPHFTSPDIQHTRLDQVLQNQEHENFAIISLIFMILLPGRAPYAHIGGTTPGENVMNRNFPYPMNVKIKQKEWEALKDKHKDKIVDFLNKQIKYWKTFPPEYWNNFEESSPIIFESLSSNMTHPWNSALVSEWIKNSKSKLLKFRDYEGKRPPGIFWGPMWSHLHPQVRLSFYETFRLGIYTPIEKWIKIMVTYRSFLNKLEEGDIANDIYQTEYKKINVDKEWEYR